jgi:hypothetical protein
MSVTVTFTDAQWAYISGLLAAHGRVLTAQIARLQEGLDEVRQLRRLVEEDGLPGLARAEGRVTAELDGRLRRLVAVVGEGIDPR